jgi:hypothetical protein
VFDPDDFDWRTRADRIGNAVLLALQLAALALAYAIVVELFL